ncbi:uncharacterized protein LOC126108329 [Schistocerca cancellata]|uniref:uncharacterized protein LOC126108329 n=1 Tax=Schistocerca cancellata TaxID=274614 RepID=UPI002119B313|nr:uncharacterized protein LOC126108329 [Schistocerca cancellata]
MVQDAGGGSRDAWVSLAAPHTGRSWDQRRPLWWAEAAPAEWLCPCPTCSPSQPHTLWTPNCAAEEEDSASRPPQPEAECSVQSQWRVATFQRSSSVIAAEYCGALRPSAAVSGELREAEQPRESSTMEAVQEVSLGALLDAGDGAVVTLVAGDTRLVAHRAILAARSPVIAAMFRHGTPEASSGQLAVPDVEGPVLQELLGYLYTLQAPQLPGMAHQLLAAADRYGVSVLKAES